MVGKNPSEISSRAEGMHAEIQDIVKGHAVLEKHVFLIVIKRL